MNRRLGHTVATASAAFLLLAGTAGASDLNYDYAELRYVDTEIDGDGGGDADGDGFEIGGSVQLADNWHIFGSYQTLDFDFDIDLSALEIGAGYMVPVNSSTDLVARVSYIDGEVDTPFGDADDSGFGLSSGFRHLFSPQIEGRAFINYVDLDDSGSETSFELAGDYFINDQFSAGLGLEFGDDATSISIGARYYFGNMRR